MGEYETSHEDLDSAHEETGPSPWLWHVCLFFRPRTFFLRFAANQVPMLTASCAWLYGMSGAIDRTEKNFLRGRPTPWLDDWSTYWLAITLIGAVGGIFFYVIGGWWYRLRITWSGTPSPDPGLAKRVYLFSSQVYALPIILATMIESSLYDTPLASAQSEGSLWYLPLLVFPFWSAFCSYKGVRTMFEVRRSRALVWFLVLPSIVYSLAFVALFALLLHSEPDLDQPQVYRGSTMEFSYPGNWWWNLEQTEDGLESVALEGMGDSFVRLMSYASSGTPAQELEFSLEDYRQAGQWTPGESFFSWGPLNGVGGSGTYTEDGTPVEMRLFVSAALGDRFVEYQAFFVRDELEQVLPVLELFGETLRLK